MTLEEACLLSEDIHNTKIYKFWYERWKHTPVPKVIILDPHYCYNGRGKKIEGMDDILAFNYKYSDDKKETRKNLQDIMDFANLLEKDKQDIYQRIKKLYPESLKYIRHYKRDAVKYLKVKDGLFWKKVDVNSL